MQLSQFLRMVEQLDLEAHEVAPFARLTELYLEARARGLTGLPAVESSDEDREYLTQLFDYDLASAVYIHPLLEGFLAEHAPSTAGRTEQQFEVFWAEYPRKTAKAAARKAWARKVGTHATAVRVTRALQAQIKAGIFQKDVDFIPHAATWINQERWEDEVPAQAAANNTFLGVV